MKPSKFWRVVKLVQNSNKKKDENNRSGENCVSENSAYKAVLPPPSMYQYLSPVVPQQAFSADLDEFINQKTELSRLRIGLLKTEINERKSLKTSNLEKIKKDICICRDLINKIIKEDELTDERIKLEEKIFDLEKEKRQQHENFFRDIQRLNKELREALIETVEEAQKRNMFLEKPQKNIRKKNNKSYLIPYRPFPPCS